MARRSYRPEQIIRKIREGEVLLSQGYTVGKATRKLGITEQTYYRWRREYGGMRIQQVKRLKELEKENTRRLRVIRTAICCSKKEMHESESYRQ